VIPLTIESLAEGGYLATSPIWSELLAQGRTISETLEIAQDVARKLIESYLAHGDPVPAEVANAMAQPQTPLHLQIAIPALA
jgi:antitoxin HicB